MSIQSLAPDFFQQHEIKLSTTSALVVVVSAFALGYFATTGASNLLLYGTPLALATLGGAAILTTTIIKNCKPKKHPSLEQGKEAISSFLKALYKYHNGECDAAVQKDIDTACEAVKSVILEKATHYPRYTPRDCLNMFYNLAEITLSVATDPDRLNLENSEAISKLAWIIEQGQTSANALLQTQTIDSIYQIISNDLYIKLEQEFPGFIDQKTFVKCAPMFLKHFSTPITSILEGNSDTAKKIAEIKDEILMPFIERIQTENELSIEEATREFVQFFLTLANHFKSNSDTAKKTTEIKKEASMPFIEDPIYEILELCFSVAKYLNVTY